MRKAHSFLLLTFAAFALEVTAQSNSIDSCPEQNPIPAVHSKENPGGRTIDTDVAKYLGGWYYVPEDSFFYEHNWIKTNYGNWIEFKVDGTWREVLDNWDMRLEQSGIWTYEQGQLIQHLPYGKPRNYSYTNNTLVVQDYSGKLSVACFEPAPTPPDELLGLPPIPQTVEEAVEVLKSALSEEQKAYLVQFAEFEVREREPMLTCMQLGLDRGNAQLLDACGRKHPWAAARVIHLALLKSLREDRPDSAAYEKLEQALHTPIQTFDAKGMSLEIFVRQLSVRMKEALRKAGRPDDINIISSNPDPTKQMNPFLWEEPSIHIWGLARPEDIRYTTIADICAMQHDEDLDGPGPHRVNLIPPSTIELLLHGCDDTWKSYAPILMEPVKWGRHNIEALLFSAEFMKMGFVGGPEKTGCWLMNGEQPPMPVDEVAKFALDKIIGSEDYIIDHIDISNNSHNGFVYYDRTRPTHWRRPECRNIWSYNVACIKPKWCYHPGELKIEYAFASEYGKWTFDYVQTVFSPECEWTDYTKMPPLSPEDAIGKLRHYLKTTWDIDASFEDVRITLQRIAGSNYWYYAIESYGFVGGERTAAVGYVLLDGTVIPVKSMTQVTSEYDWED